MVSLLVIVLLISPVGILILLFIFQRKSHPWLIKHANLLGAYRSLGWLLTIPILLGGGYLGFLELRESLLGKPDVTLVFGRPSRPVFWVLNSSPKLAREPKYQFLIYNLSLPGAPDPYMNLRIPAKIIDPIRPGRDQGPWTLQSVARKGSEIQEGHHLFGYGEVECPDCEQVHSYWIYAQVGVAGWYAEIPANETKAILKNLADVIHGGKDFLTKISNLVPVNRRIAMASDN
jgi:hypothetical protein